MVVFPNAKINIGLSVVKKRQDGFHNLETVFYPVGLCDILEINEAEGNHGECFFRNTGIDTNCLSDDNLVVRAYKLMADIYKLPAVKIHLHKIIPFGAGLGGGSADASFMLKALNEYFGLNITDDELLKYASLLGSDCPFFIHNRPAFAHGKGDILDAIELNLNDYRIVLVKPDIGVSTPEAYSGISPAPASFDLRKLNQIAVSAWPGLIKNDFEKTVFLKYPQLSHIKQKLYDAGAIYASMTGSGSAIFALFSRNKQPVLDFGNYFTWIEE